MASRAREGSAWRPRPKAFDRALDSASAARIWRDLKPLFGTHGAAFAVALGWKYLTGDMPPRWDE
jgi:hypothetical protein